MFEGFKSTMGDLLKALKIRIKAFSVAITEKAIAIKEGEGPVIRLPRDKKRVADLQKKLAEYQRRRSDHLSRMDAYKAPEIWFDTDSEHKIAVLSELIKKGRIGTWALSRRLVERFGIHFDVGAYERACTVIEDYCKTGGANVRGGTGLARTEKTANSAA